MVTIPTNIEEILKRTAILELELGVSKEDSTLLSCLTDLQYLFCLEWSDPSLIVMNKKQWAEEKGFRRDKMYQWLSAHPKTTQAIAYLQSKLNQNQCVQLSKVIYQKGMTGDIRAAKLYLEHFQPEETVTHSEVDEEETFVLDHKWTKPDEKHDVKLPIQPQIEERRQ